MPFRNDHDAAVARADALDRELAETRQRLARAEAALDEREAVVDEAPAPQLAPMPALARAPRPSPWGPVVGIVIAIGLLVLISHAIAALRADQRDTAERMEASGRAAAAAVQRRIVREFEDMSHPRDCTIRGHSGEQLVVREAGTEQMLGTIGVPETHVPWSGHPDLRIWLEGPDGIPLGLDPARYTDCHELTLVQE